MGVIHTVIGACGRSGYGIAGSIENSEILRWFEATPNDVIEDHHGVVNGHGTVNNDLVIAFSMVFPQKTIEATIVFLGESCVPDDEGVKCAGHPVASRVGNKGLDSHIRDLLLHQTKNPAGARSSAGVLATLLLTWDAIATNPPTCGD